MNEDYAENFEKICGKEAAAVYQEILFYEDHKEAEEYSEGDMQSYGCSSGDEVESSS
jgi:hypothetical protein